MSNSFALLNPVRKLLYFVLLLLVFASPVYSQEIDGDNQPATSESSRAHPVRKHVPGRVLVIVDPSAEEAESERAIRAVGGRAVESDPQTGLRIVDLTPGTDEESAVRALRGRPGVLAAELDEIVPLSDVIPNDPNYPKQTHLTAIRGPQAWVTTTGSPSIIVAVIDTGVNGAHPDLAPRLLPGWNVYDNNANFADVYGHGTKVAGTITAATNNGAGVASVCWNCMILPIRASQTNGSATYSALATGLRWAADHGARVANISYQVSSSSAVTSAAQYFMGKGGLVFAAAGNYSTNDPAPDNPYIVTVSGVDQGTKLLHSWSNYGNNIDVTAPGCTNSTTLNTLGYGSGCGTSYASPIAAGVGALIFSADPSLSPAKALTILRSSAIDFGTAGWDIKFGAGMVNAEAAVALARGGSIDDTVGPVVSVTSPTAGMKIKGPLTASASISDASGTVDSVSFKVGTQQVCTFVAAPYTCSIDSRAFPDGNATFVVVATDNSGNTTTASIAITIENADVTKPVVAISSPAAGASVSGVVNVAFTATDAAGVAGITVAAGSTAVCSVVGTATSCPWDTTKSSNGSVVVTVTARDEAGNTQTASVSVNVANGDPIAPTVTISSPVNGATVSGTTSVSFTVADNIGVVSTVVTAGSTTLCSVAGPASSCSWNTLLAANGATVVSVTAKDAAGNSRSATVNVTVSNADMQKPTVTITAPVEGATVSGTATISFSAKDNVGVAGITVTAGASTVCSVGGTATSCSWSTTTVANGSYTITVTARDAAGNTLAATRTVTVNNADKTAPTVTISAPAAGATVSGSVNVGLNSSDNVKVTKVVLSVNSAAICTLTTPTGSCAWNTVASPNGSATLVASAYDAAGNIGTAQVVVTVANITSTSPVVSFVSPTETTLQGSVLVQVSATDDTGVKNVIVSVNGKPICHLGGKQSSCMWNTEDFPNGPYVLEAIARDTTNNAGTVAKNVTVNNPAVSSATDTVKPMTVITGPVYGDTLKGTVSASFVAYDNKAVAKVVLRLNTITLCLVNSASGMCSIDTTRYADGLYNLTAVAYDTSGNAALSYIQVRVGNTVVPNETAGVVEEPTLDADDGPEIQPIPDSAPVAAPGDPIEQL